MSCQEIYDRLIGPVFDNWINQARQEDQVVLTTRMNHLIRYSTNYGSCQRYWESMTCQKIEAANIKDKDVFVAVYAEHVGLLTRPSTDAAVIALHRYDGYGRQELIDKYNQSASQN